MTAEATPRKRHALDLFDGIAADYDRWAQILSFGNDRRWHDLLVDRLDVGPDSVVADVATGTAAIAMAIAWRHGSRVIGIDQNAAMLETGRRRVHAAGLERRIELRHGEAERLPLDDGSVDALVHTYLLRYVDDPPAVLRELARPIRPGGQMASLEFGVPGGAWYPAWWAWTRIGLPAGGLLAGDGWYATGRFLGPSIERFWREHPLEEVLGWWADAGMAAITAQRLSVGGGVIIRGTRT
jgi:demethylmenaquinone methyltransferase / 2-methoxy-6-polyprenyl-1,4-benzoquinol methylase